MCPQDTDTYDAEPVEHSPDDPRMERDQDRKIIARLLESLDTYEVVLDCFRTDNVAPAKVNRQKTKILVSRVNGS